MNMPSQHAEKFAASPRRSDEPISILMVVDAEYPFTGGAEMQVRLLSSVFSRMGHRVRILTPLVNPAHPVSERIDGIEVRRLAYPRIKIFGAILLDLRFAAYLLRHHREFDAVHIHMVRNLAGAAGWLQRWVRPTMVAKVSGADEFKGGILDPALLHRPIHRLLNAGARQIDAFQCISAHTRKAMLQVGYAAAKMHLIPNAVDCRRFDCPREPEAALRRVAFVGRHVPVKGLDVLLRAWAQVRRPDGLQLVLAGDGPERTRMVTLAAELGVAGSVEFPGKVDDVPALLAGAGLYVQASYQEGLPNAVLEAMASGLAVVATRVSGHEDVVEHGVTGLLVPPDDPAALAQALQALIDDAVRRHAMGLRGRDAVTRGYGTDIIADRLLALYGARVTSPRRSAGLSRSADANRN